MVEIENVESRVQTQGSWFPGVMETSELMPIRTATRARVHGASVIKCGYAATGMYMTAAADVLRESANTRTSLSHKTTRRTDTRDVPQGQPRVASPACIAGVRVSCPNFNAPCGRTKL